MGDQFEDIGPELEEALGAGKAQAQATLRRQSSMGVRSSAPPSHTLSQAPGGGWTLRALPYLLGRMTSQELRDGEKGLTSCPPANHPVYLLRAPLIGIRVAVGPKPRGVTLEKHHQPL